MNEIQRRQYLQAMDIDSYMPRFLLPGAMPSPLCALPLPASLDSLSLTNSPTAQSETSSSPQQRNHSDAAKQALGIVELTTGSNSSQRANPELKTTKPQVEKPTSPVFSLSIIRGDKLMIVDKGLPGNINPNEYLQLLQNILFAIGAGRQPLSIDGFVWPMVKNSAIDQSETAARQTLDAFLGKQIQQLNAQYVLLMGPDAAHYIAEENTPTGALIDLPRLGVTVFRTLSAIDMLEDNTLKREAWQQLQPLRHALK